MDSLLSFYPAVSKVCEKLSWQELKNVSVVSKSWWAVTHDIIVNRVTLELSSVPKEHIAHLKRNYKKIFRRTDEAGALQIPSSATDVELEVSLHKNNFRELYDLKKMKHLGLVLREGAPHSTPQPLNQGLESLKIELWSEEILPWIKNLLEANKESLRKLHVTWLAVGDIFYLENIIFPNLNSFSFSTSYPDILKAETFEKFFKHHSKLQEITLYQVPEHFTDLLLRNCTNTKKINIKFDCVTSERASDLVKISSLESLVLHNTIRSLDLMNMKSSNLQSLKTRFKGLFSEENFEIFLKSNQKLRSLNLLLFDSHGRQNIQLSAITRHIPEIYELHLRNLNLQRLEGVQTFAKLQHLSLDSSNINHILLSLRAPSLRSFKFYGTDISERGIKALIENSPMVEDLLISSSSKLDDFCTKLIVENLVYLKYLDISSCENITNLSLELILVKSMIITTRCEYSSLRTDSELRNLANANGFDLEIGKLFYCCFFF